MAKKWLLEHILYEDMKVEKWRSSSLSTDESSILTDEDKEIIKNIVDFFEKTYHFKIEPNSNVASIPTEVSN